MTSGTLMRISWFQAFQLDAVGAEGGEVILRSWHKSAFGAAIENL